MRVRWRIPSWPAWVAVAVLAAGCATPNAGSDGSAGGPDAPANPAVQLREQLSSGGFQFDAAIDSIAGALATAQSLAPQLPSGEAREGCAEAAEILDACGKLLAEHADEPPSETEVAAAFASFDDRRLKAIEAGNDVFHDLNEAAGILESLADRFPPRYTGEYATLQTQVVEAIDDVAGAIEAFGGKVEAIDG